MKDSSEKQFIKNKEDVIENLEAIQLTLEECTEEGMLDLESQFHNEILDLLDEAHLSKEDAELAEVISKAKTLEADIDVWLAMKGRNTLSISWPTLPD